LLLDTSGIYCTLDRSDPRRNEAVAHYRRARVRLVHSAILTEFQPLAMKLGLPRSVTHRVMTNLINDPTVEKVWVDDALLRRGIQLLEARADKSYSLCDAVSFVLMRERGIGEALTLDHHFEQEGFQRLLTA
jgi:predicted nucleic acid-binding protein